jgi:predicted alpha/beta-fold hydrolase
MVAGLNDPRIPFAEVEPQTKAPNVKHCYLSPGGHMGHIEDAEKCLEAIQAFLKMA